MDSLRLDCTIPSGGLLQNCICRQCRKTCRRVIASLCVHHTPVIFRENLIYRDGFGRILGRIEKSRKRLSRNVISLFLDNLFLLLFWDGEIKALKDSINFY